MMNTLLRQMNSAGEAFWSRFRAPLGISREALRGRNGSETARTVHAPSPSSHSSHHAASPLFCIPVSLALPQGFCGHTLVSADGRSCWLMLDDTAAADVLPPSRVLLPLLHAPQ